MTIVNVRVEAQFLASETALDALRAFVERDAAEQVHGLEDGYNWKHVEQHLTRDTMTFAFMRRHKRGEHP